MSRAILTLLLCQLNFWKILLIANINGQWLTIWPENSSPAIGEHSGAPDAGTERHLEAPTLMSWDHYANYFNLDQDLAVTAQRNQDPLPD